MKKEEKYYQIYRIHLLNGDHFCTIPRSNYAKDVTYHRQPPQSTKQTGAAPFLLEASSPLEAKLETFHHVSSHPSYKYVPDTMNNILINPVLFPVYSLIFFSTPC